MLDKAQTLLDSMRRYYLRALIVRNVGTAKGQPTIRESGRLSCGWSVLNEFEISKHGIYKLVELSTGGSCSKLIKLLLCTLRNVGSGGFHHDDV